MAVFLIIVLSVHALVNLYIFMRGWQALEGFPAIKPWYIATFVVLFLSYILGRILMKAAPGVFSSVMIWIGSFWLAFMLYFFLLIVLLDLLRLLNHWFHIFPGFITANYEKTKGIALLASVVCIVVIVGAGYLNALRPVVRKLDISIPKSAGKLKELKLVMASDIHLGTLVGRNRLNNLVRTVNGLEPDIVLLVGDVVDEDIEPVVRLNLGEMLQSLKARYGVYAVPGNHEYIGGGENAFAYLRAHGVTVLRDSMVCIDSSFLLVGRDDRDGKRFSGGGRKEVAELIAGADTTLPMILMDHQPFAFEKAQQAGVDLQLSGHTHAGQMWPLNYITGAIYEIDHGYLKKGKTHFYVSNGAGSWGPPLRIGNRPEIVQITIHFKD
jgi:predicted MPP superfamily phosphohydrolase